MYKFGVTHNLRHFLSNMIFVQMEICLTTKFCKSINAKVSCIVLFSSQITYFLCELPHTTLPKILVLPLVIFYHYHCTNISSIILFLKKILFFSYYDFCVKCVPMFRSVYKAWYYVSQALLLSLVVFLCKQQKNKLTLQHYTINTTHAIYIAP